MTWVYDSKREAYTAVFPIAGAPVRIFVSDGHFTTHEPCDALPLREGEYYHYELEGDYKLSPKSSFVSRAARSGQLRTKTYVGFGRLWLEGYEEREACLHLKVASTVIDYEDDYQQLLTELTDEVADLQMQILSEVSGQVALDAESPAVNSIQQFFFLLGIVLDENFDRAMHTIVSHPHIKLTSVMDQHDIRRASRFNRGMLREIASASRRMEVPKGLGERLGFNSLPMHLNNTHRIETVDTPENRFIKYVLNFFRKRLKQYKETIDKDENVSRYAVEVDLSSAIARLEGWLSHAWFRQIGELSSMPTGSMVLQRREGYREILRKFLQANAAARITWEAGESLYRANQKDVATLYEYWCYFKLLRIVRRIFTIELGEIKEKLWGVGKDCLSLKLHEGKMITLTGRYKSEVGGVRYRDLAVDFKYNYRFNRHRQESWTSQMIPDYTIAFRPACYDEAVAKENNLITYVHFDAKYKVKNLIQDFASTDEEDEFEKDVKQIDLYKMHTYRDAIGRTGGAYVLYPGTETKDFKQVEGEIVPGLGAFPLTPNSKQQEEPIKRFLEEAAAYFCDRISKWEKYTYERANIYGMKESLYHNIQSYSTDFLEREKTFSEEKTIDERLSSRFWDVSQTLSIMLRSKILEMKWLYDTHLCIQPEPDESKSDYGRNLTLRNLKTEDAARHIRTIAIDWMPPLLLIVNQYYGCFTGEQVVALYPTFKDYPIPLSPTRRYHIWAVSLLDETPFKRYLFDDEEATNLRYQQQYAAFRNKTL